MSNWDDEEFEIESGQAAATAASAWDDEEELGEDVAESWEALEDDEEKAAKEAAKKAAKNAEPKLTPAERAELRKAERAKAEEEARIAAEKAAAEAEEDAETKRERLKNAQIEADLASAETLLGTVSVSAEEKPKPKPKVVKLGAKGISIGGSKPVASKPKPEAPTAEQKSLQDQPLFNPKTKDGFDELRKALSAQLKELSKYSYYAPFVPQLTTELLEPLSGDQTRKLAQNLIALSNEKIRNEKLEANKAKQAKKRPNLGGASAKLNDDRDLTDYGNSPFDEDDFM
ncbi:hypothetical protein CANCADRAFT_141969 [Tortispora caseinolytica NRRL Y-17796]|uniref:Eukaryotic translation initiation factor 3 subunit J n=1 Tax=Tortispora caseinolytica NRRL Y-17796 TaxID=767744 RepID=A0A1E4TD95_9ASCO|nr:hypothetical protein CANCADRAFT_141969 [Tortispora caseinolytica NRRL Y-17796]